MTSGLENQETPKWVVDVLYDIQKFAQANNLHDLATELLSLERKYRKCSSDQSLAKT